MLARAKITYTHAGTFTPLTTRYRTYTRALVPSGSVLRSASGALRGDRLAFPNADVGDVDVSQELGFYIFWCIYGN